MKKPLPPPPPSRVTVPARAHPLAKFAFSEMARQRMTYLETEFRAGVLVSTVKAWRKDNHPGLDTMEAVLGALGWSLLPVPKPEALPPELRADLEAVAEKHEREFPGLEFIAAAVGRKPNTRLPYSTAQGARPVSRELPRNLVGQASPA